MDINLLTLNVGHSRLAVGVFQAGELVYSRRLSIEDRRDWVGVIGEAWERIRGQANAEVAGAAVNLTAMGAVESAVREATSQLVQWVGDELDLPMPVGTKEPEQTGTDRVLAMAAAYEQIGHACCVVDAGTCVTVNFCDDNGAFLGGAIAPGATLQMKAMHQAAPGLPVVEAGAIEPAALGNDTTSAMKQGVYHGIRGLVRETIEAFALERGNWPELIVTGGDAEWLFGGWEIVHAVSPDLVLYGVAKAYAEHHIKHGT